MSIQESFSTSLANEKNQFDAIILFGYGPVQPGRILGSGKLNVFGRINALAAGMLYKKYKVGTIIPTGGKTGGSDKPSEASLMAQIIKSRFGVVPSVFVLEENATNTILNIVYIANIIDQFPNQYKNLLFVSMGFHIPRIKEICSLVKLDGHFLTAEAEVSTRSERHHRLLQNLFDPEKESYAKIIVEQKRWYYGLREIPEYWLPQMAMIENPTRLRRILQTEHIQPFLHSQGMVDVQSVSLDNLRAWLNSIPRKFPK